MSKGRLSNANPTVGARTGTSNLSLKLLYRRRRVRVVTNGSQPGYRFSSQRLLLRLLYERHVGGCAHCAPLSVTSTSSTTASSTSSAGVRCVMAPVMRLTEVREHSCSAAVDPVRIPGVAAIVAGRADDTARACRACSQIRTSRHRDICDVRLHAFYCGALRAG